MCPQGAEGDGSEDEEMDDEAMMKLDGSIAALFLEQKKKTEAKKHEKERARKEKVLVRDFKIKVPLQNQEDLPLFLVGICCHILADINHTTRQTASSLIISFDQICIWYQ